MGPSSRAAGAPGPAAPADPRPRRRRRRAVRPRRSGSQPLPETLQDGGREPLHLSGVGGHPPLPEDLFRCAPRPGTQTQATELAPNARGAAVALHAFFFFLGQAAGPICYGFGFAHIGPTATLMIAAAVIGLLAFVVARLLSRGPA